MQFLYPQFLWALLALAIPIIIHLFYFKRFKKVLFTNVRFLKEIKEETSARNKLKNLLVLLSRMLALTFLVFAFAKPFIPLKNDAKQGKSAISIFVDNSFSMSATQGNTPLLPIAKNKALEIINSYSDDDRFQILSNEFAGKQQRLLSKDDAINMLDEIELTPSAKTMSRIINRQKQLLHNSNDNKIAYVLSDFQSSIVDDFDLQDSTFELNLVPIQSVVEKNVSIDSVWFESQIPMVDQNNTLLIRVSNLSLEDANGMILSYAKDGEEKPISTLDIPAKTSVIDTVSIPLFKTGNHEVVVKINDGAISFDDSYNISFDVANQVKVLAINQSVPNPYITKSFEGIHFFELENMPASQINYQAFNTFNLIILNELDQLSSGLIAELKKYVETGGKLLVFPSDKADINSYNNLLNSFKSNTLISKEGSELEVSKINTEEFIFNDVFDRITNNLKLPKTSLHYARTKFQNKLDENLLTFRDNTSFLSKTTFGEGILYFCSSPLSTKYNDLSQVGEIFIPML
ncbi:MAG: BatA domain-containing protein [Saprospiraceae bacterium]